MPAPKKVTEATDDTTPVTPVTEVKETLYGFPVLGRASYLLSEIKKKTNIRTEKNETAEDENLRDSIKANSILNPLIVNKSNELLDGYRRYHNAKELNIKTPIPVVILGVPDNRIAYFQYLCGLEKGLSKEESLQGILKHASDNPDELDVAIAKLFGVSHTTVSNATKILRKAPSLAALVSDKKISQRAALKVVETASKYNKNAEKCASTIVEKLKDKLEKGTCKSADVIRQLREIIPGENIQEQKSKSERSAKSLLKDLFLQLKPVPNSAHDSQYSQEYSAILSNELVALIENTINKLDISEEKEREPEIYSFEESDRTVSSFHYNCLLKVYLDESFKDASKSVFLAVPKDDGSGIEAIVTLDENADFWIDLLRNKNVEISQISSLSCLKFSPEDVSIEYLDTIAQEQKLKVHILYLELKVSSAVAPVLETQPLTTAIEPEIPSLHLANSLDLANILEDGAGYYEIEEDEDDEDDEDDEEYGI